jgi:poly(3-hydroxybutyrate) depolymerase
MKASSSFFATKPVTALLVISWMNASCGGGDATTVTNQTTSGSNNSVLYKGTSGDFDKTITVGTASRRYLLHVPVSYKSDTAMPEVVLFHGGQGSAMLNSTQN